MAQTAPKDKPAARAPEEDEASVRELVEAVAAAYFGACRKIATLLNRKRRG